MKGPFFPFSCPGRWDLSQKWAPGPFAQVQHQDMGALGVLVLGKGMWCEGCEHMDAVRLG